MLVKQPCQWRTSDVYRLLATKIVYMYYTRLCYYYYGWSKKARSSPLNRLHLLRCSRQPCFLPSTSANICKVTLCRYANPKEMIFMGCKSSVRCALSCPVDIEWRTGTGLCCPHFATTIAAVRNCGHRRCSFSNALVFAMQAWVPVSSRTLSRPLS